MIIFRLISEKSTYRIHTRLLTEDISPEANHLSTQRSVVGQIYDVPRAINRILLTTILLRSLAHLHFEKIIEIDAILMVLSEISLIFDVIFMIFDIFSSTCPNSHPDNNTRMSG